MPYLLNSFDQPAVFGGRDLRHPTGAVSPLCRGDRARIGGQRCGAEFIRGAQPERPHPPVLNPPLKHESVGPPWLFEARISLGEAHPFGVHNLM